MDESSMMNMLNRDRDTALVTVGMVANKKALRDRKTAERDKLDAEIAELDKWLEAASLLAGADVVAQTITDAVEADQSDDEGDAENMADAAKRILAAFPKGLGHAQLQHELRKIPLFGERLGKNPNYYYTMISRLKKRGDIVKNRKLLRLPQPKITEAVFEEVETAAT